MKSSFQKVLETLVREAHRLGVDDGEPVSFTLLGYATEDSSNQTSLTVDVIAKYEDVAPVLGVDFANGYTCWLKLKRDATRPELWQHHQIRDEWVQRFDVNTLYSSDAQRN